MTIHPNLSDATYRAWPGLSGTGAVRLLRSPAKFRFAPPRDSAAMSLGRMVHGIVLGGEPEWVLSPFDDFRSKDAQAWRGSQTLPIVKQADIEEAERIAAAVWEHPTALDLLLAVGPTELSVTWERHGKPMKGRLDKVIGTQIVDLKTGRDANPATFGKTVADYGYHVQMGHYGHGLVANGHELSAPPIFIVVETEAPHLVSVVQLDVADWAQGLDLATEAARRYAEYLDADVWPGYGDSIQPATIPTWAYRQWDNHLGHNATATIAELERLIGGNHD